MSKRTFSLVILVCIVAGLTFAQSSYVFEVPGANGSTTQIFGEGDNDFQRYIGPATVLPGTFRVLALPDQSGYYLITPTSVQSASPTFGNLTTISGITGNIYGSGLTPDGKYLLIMADHFYIVTTGTNSVATADSTLPGTAIDFAVSSDSQTIWILANANLGAQSAITTVNSSTLQSGQTQILPYPATSMTLSSLGLLYVTYAADKVDEIDPATLNVTPSGRMNVPNGEVSGRLYFTPDGSTAFSENSNGCTFNSCFILFQLNVAAHSFTGLPFDPNNPLPVFDNIMVAGINNIYGYSSTAGSTVAKLWDITTSPLSAAPTALPLGIPTSIIQSVVMSDERPIPRYLFVLNSDPNRPLLRVGLTDGTIAPSTAAVGPALSFASIPAQSGSATSLVTLNTTQTLLPGATVAPLIAYATDGVGRPIFKQQVCFSPDSSASVATPSQLTNANGRVQTAVTVPSSVGTYHVTVNLGPCGSSSTSSTFTINVGTNSGPSGSNQISIYTGDGQLIPQFTAASQPLTVKVTNSDGITPLAGVPVVFAITAGAGSLSDPQTLTLGSSITETTDVNGNASVGFTAGGVDQSVSFQPTTVNASSALGSIDFIETTHNAPSLPDGLGKPIFTTNNFSSVTVAEGQVLSAPITATTMSARPPQNGVPIPNVGIRLADPTSGTLAPSAYAACQGSSRGDSSGVSRCNVIGICQPAGTSFPLSVNALASVGEAAFFPVVITLTQGTASQITVKSTDPQAGTPGSSFVLVGQITDGCGQPVGNVPVTWTVSGAGQPPATLSGVSTVSSPDGNVSATVKLGNTPGAVLVQVSAGTAATAVFHLTNQIAVTSITPVVVPPSVVVGNAFGALVFEVRDANGNDVPSIQVNFSLSGTGAAGASVNANATTNLQGRVQANVVAGPNAGTIAVTASYLTLTGTATLTATLPGPQFTSSSFTNAASGTIGMTPCGLVTVRGSNLAPGVQGVVSGMNLFGPLPITLAGVSITVQQGSNNPIPVPIREVANDQSGQRVTFQAPCELVAASPLSPGSATVTITANTVATTVNNVNVFASQPGLFTFTATNSKQYGVAIREVDGSYVTPTNLARQGDKIYLVVTGLGQVTPAATTNSAGVGSQNVNVPMLVFLNNTAITPLSARYLFGSIGAYLVEFQIPANFPVGTDLNILALATANNGNDFIVGNTTLLAGVTTP